MERQKRMSREEREEKLSRKYRIEEDKMGKKKKKKSKRALDPLTVVLSMWRSNMGREAGGNRDGSSPQAGKRERFTCTFYLDVCQTRQLQSDREREKERQ